MTITLELPEDVAIIVEQAAGKQDVAAYAVGVLHHAAQRKLARRAAAVDYELTPADHIRMAAEAEATASPIVEVMQRLNAYMDAAMVGGNVAVDEPTAADHIRMAAEAEATAVPFAEFKARLYAKIAAEEAVEAAGH